MKASLAGCWLKNRRAAADFKGLYDEVTRFQELKPYDTAAIYNPDTGIYRLIVESFTTPPKEWAITVGGILHNLRSCLDHLVWQLTISNGHVPPPFPLPKKSPWKNIQFPISLNKQEFTDYAIPGYLWGIRNEARRFIERAQPFDKPDYPLWLLGELSNIDKHRTLALTAAYLDRVRIVPSSGTHWTPQFAVDPDFLEPKTEIAVGTLFPPPRRVPMDMGRIEVKIVFAKGMGPAEGRGLISTLARMGEETRKILKGARPWA